jgi:hypothetical protein
MLDLDWDVCPCQIDLQSPQRTSCCSATASVRRNCCCRAWRAPPVDTMAAAPEEEDPLTLCVEILKDGYADAFIQFFSLS